MTTLNDYSKGSYPANKHVIKELGAVRGHLLCRIYWATNLKDGVCRMGITRLGDEIGFDRSTVSRAANSLVKDGYILKVKNADQKNGEPPHYKVTDKFFALIPIEEDNTPVAQDNTPLLRTTPPVVDGNTPVAQGNKDIDSSDIDSSKIGSGEPLPDRKSVV